MDLDSTDKCINHEAAVDTFLWRRQDVDSTDKRISHGAAIDTFFWRELDAAGMAENKSWHRSGHFLQDRSGCCCSVDIRMNTGMSMDTFFWTQPDAEGTDKRLNEGAAHG